MPIHPLPKGRGLLGRDTKGIRIMSKLNVCVKSDVSNVVFNQNGKINVMASLSAPDVEDASKKSIVYLCGD